jgi:hypothetical protein
MCRIFNILCEWNSLFRYSIYVELLPIDEYWLYIVYLFLKTISYLQAKKLPEMENLFIKTKR